MIFSGKRFYRVNLILILFLQLLHLVQAQQPASWTGNPAVLRKLAEQQEAKHKVNKARVQELSKKPNWIIQQNTKGKHFVLQGISDAGKPLYYTTYNNSVSAITTNTNRVWSGGTAGLNLSGASSLLSGKLGIWDGGAVLGTHQELTGRVVNRDNATTISHHATHVAGTMIATGIYAPAKGMAFQVPNLQAWDLTNDHSEIAAAASGLLLSNHSYGYQAGWVSSGGKWYWLGDVRVSTKDDVYFGYYDSYAQLWDDYAYNAPYYLMVKAAGNSRNMAEPAVGTPYYWHNPSTGAWVLNSEGRSADMRSYNGYDVIADHSVAKNILTVGAISQLDNGYYQPSDVVAYLASSYGPTDDGRIKPDLVGSGIRVTSTWADNNTSYTYATGTSMAAPNITGSLLLLQQHYANLTGGSFMRSATLKGLAIHAAHEAGAAPGPDYSYGWGVLDTDEAARVLSSSAGKDLVAELQLSQGNTYSRTFTAAGTAPIKITICWTDPKGPVYPLQDSTALNNRSPRLVNDLDITLQGGGSTFLPWVLDPDNPAAPATTGNNFRDNVEQIVIANPVPGQTYTLQVNHKSQLENGFQDFALIISGMAGTPYCASAPAGTSSSRIGQVTFGTIQHATASGCGAYADYTAVSTNVEIGKTMPLSLSLQNCGATPVDKTAKVYIDWNEDGDFDDADENVLTTPVVSNSATITGNVTIPTYVRVDSGTRLRVVLVETATASQVTACGTYPAGETEDYTVRFVRRATDVGISALAIPTASTLWAHASQRLTVRLKNYDAVAQTSIPVTVTVKTGATTVATLSGTFAGTLQPLQEALFTLPGTFAVNPATAYTFAASTSLSGDHNSANNTFTTTLTSSGLAPGPAITATSCAESALASLKGSGAGALVWFDAATGGNTIALGTDTTTTFKPANNIYFAALNEYAGTTLALQNTTAGTFSSQVNDTIYFKARTSLLLDQVTINAGTGGQATVALFRPDGTLLDSAQLTLVSGVADYGLNFSIPAAATEYRLLISRFYAGTTASQNNGAGTVVFPYTIPTLVTIRRSVSGASYLYNWKFRPGGSPSARVSVKANGLLAASQTTVCSGDNSGTITLSKYHDTIARWEQSADKSTWSAIAHTGPALAFQDLTATTHFRAVVQAGSCTNAFSDPITITVNPTPVASITAAEGTVLCPGAPLPLTAGTADNYLWSTGETTAQIQVYQPGSYWLRVTSAAGCQATDTITISAKPVAWTGQADSDWFNAANWNCQVPDATTDVHIPAGLLTYPTIGPGEAYCRNLVIEGSLSVSGGNLKMLGNFTNTGTFSHPEGTLELTGTENQQISGGDFRHLTIKNPNFTTLGSNITVTGTLQVDAGILQTGSYRIVLGPTATLNETADHYITGQVETVRTFDASQTSHSFGGIGLHLSTAAAPGDIRVIRKTGQPASRATITRAYQIEVLPPGQDNNLNASMDFYYYPHELNFLDKDNLALFRSTDSGQTWVLQENSVADPTAGVYKVSLAGINAFSEWTAGDRLNSEVLPVTLLSFRAVRSQADVILTWETALEVKNAGTAIEVSGDARHYRQLHFMPAARESSFSRQTYQFIDREAGKTGVRYYRLKQSDLDGTATYYGPRAVSFAAQLPGLQLFPNPSSGSVDLLAEALADGPLLLQIKNASGQTVLATQKHLKKGVNALHLDLGPTLKPGFYLVSGHYDNRVYTRKLLLQ